MTLADLNEQVDPWRTVPCGILPLFRGPFNVMLADGSLWRFRFFPASHGFEAMCLRTEEESAPLTPAPDPL